MELKVFKNYDELSQEAANEVINLVKEKPEAVICFASGNTPLGTCQSIVKKATAEKIDFSKSTFLGLDEWVGIPPDNAGSCHFFFYENLFQPLHISDEKIFLFDVMAKDLTDECKKMDKVIAEIGGIDLMIVGIGVNGHIGFNEPGVDFNLLSHVIDLEESTKSVGQKYFVGTTELSQGITLGLAHLMNSREVILMANGKSKAEIIKKAVNDPITNELPATVMQQHKNGFIFVDEEAASLL
jgi:glucosamine-6-phosphate isomerase